MSHEILASSTDLAEGGEACRRHLFWLYMSHTYPLPHGRGIAYLLVPSLIKALRSALCACGYRLARAQEGENTSNSVFCKPHIISYVPPRVTSRRSHVPTSHRVWGWPHHAQPQRQDGTGLTAGGWLSSFSPGPALCGTGDTASRDVAGKCLLRGGGLGLKLLCFLLHHLSLLFHTP